MERDGRRTHEALGCEASWVSLLMGVLQSKESVAITPMGGHSADFGEPPFFMNKEVPGPHSQKQSFGQVVRRIVRSLPAPPAVLLSEAASMAAINKAYV
jgi:hypothetical protein